MWKISTETGWVTWDKYVITPETQLDAFVEQYPEVVSTQKRYEGSIVTTKFQLGSQSLEDEVAIASATFFDQDISRVGLDFVDDRSDDEPWWEPMQRWILASRRWLQTHFGDPIEKSSGMLFDEEEDCPPDFVALIKTNWLYLFPWGKIGLAYETLGSYVSFYVVYKHKWE